jgi:hypothetical protein
MVAAAIFDLDRTLLKGASGPELSRALREEGVIGDRSIPGEGLVTSFLTCALPRRSTSGPTTMPGLPSEVWLRPR